MKKECESSTEARIPLRFRGIALPELVAAEGAARRAKPLAGSAFPGPAGAPG